MWKDFYCKCSLIFNREMFLAHILFKISKKKWGSMKARNLKIGKKAVIQCDYGFK
jgi:hypothetical protein